MVFRAYECVRWIGSVRTLQEALRLARHRLPQAELDFAQPMGAYAGYPYRIVVMWCVMREARDARSS